MFNRYHKYLNVCFQQITNVFLNINFIIILFISKTINDKKISIFVLYNINYNEIFKFRRYLHENLNEKFIQIIRFNVIVSILFVKKSKINFRFYVNYKNLNVIIVKNRYFFFLIFEILNRFNRIKIFIKFYFDKISIQ